MYRMIQMVRLPYLTRLTQNVLGKDNTKEICYSFDDVYSSPVKDVFY